MTTTPLTDELVLETLRQVIDPELGVNIVDLGLVYRYAYAAGKLTVTMTLTTPGCPMQDSIAEGVKNILLDVSKALPTWKSKSSGIRRGIPR